MTDSESLNELLEQFRSYPDDELLDMAGSPNWALLTHQAVREVLAERGIAAPPIPEEAETIPAPAVTPRDGEPSADGAPIRSDPLPSTSRWDEPRPPSPEQPRRRRRSGSSWQVWLWVVVAFFSTCRLLNQLKSCAPGNVGSMRWEQEDDSRPVAQQQPDPQALREELERLAGKAPAAAQEDGAPSTSGATHAAEADGGHSPSDEGDPELAGPRFQWRHGPRLSSAATIAVLRASQLCQPELVTETKSPFTSEKVFVCPAPGYSSGPILPPNFIFQGAAVGSFSGTGKTEVITSLFGDDRLNKSMGASALLAYEQDGWKSLVRDHRLSLQDCQKITAKGLPDRLLCVTMEGEAIPDPTSRNSSPVVTRVVLLSATESKLEALDLAQLGEGAIRCGSGGSAGVEVTRLAQDGSAISITLEREEAKCPEVPSAITLRWRLSGAGATPDKQTRKRLEQLAIAPGPGTEAQEK